MQVLSNKIHRHECWNPFLCKAILKAAGHEKLDEALRYQAWREAAEELGAIVIVPGTVIFDDGKLPALQSQKLWED